RFSRDWSSDVCSSDLRDDGLDLLGVDEVVGQVVVDLGVGEEAALLAELDEVLEARAPGLGVFLRQLGGDEPLVLAPAAAAAALRSEERRVGRGEWSPT